MKFTMAHGLSKIQVCRAAFMVLSSSGGVLHYKQRARTIVRDNKETHDRYLSTFLVIQFRGFIVFTVAT